MSSESDKAAIIPNLSTPEGLQEFLREPFGAIAAAVTGALASGRAEFILAGGRILQAALKGHLYEQVAKEINTLTEKGKLKEDYADEPLGFKSLQELIEFIDSEAPDEDRLRGVQAMFYATNSVDTKESERILMYELFKLSKRLSGSQVRLLAILHKVKDDPMWSDGRILSAYQWLTFVAEQIGHKLPSLVELDESKLMEAKLVSQRYGGGEAITKGCARLTDLGVKFCEVLKEYDEVKQEVSSEARRPCP
jgi:hypothetical protein